MIFQWNYIIYTFIFDVLFKQLSAPAFGKACIISKEIVNLQGLFVLTVGYVDIKAYIH